MRRKSVTSGARKCIATTNHLNDCRVAVIGGGLGGLTVALACAGHGARVTVFEQAPEFGDVGAGIQISPNGARVLHALGLQSHSVGLTAQRVCLSDALTGRDLTRLDLAHHTPPYRFFHRARLLQMLADACAHAGVDLTLDAQVSQIAPKDGLTWKNGQFDADVIIGADGIHAMSRAVLNTDAPAQFTNQVAWRALIPVSNAAAQAQVWMAPGRHVVTYPVSGQTLNIVAVQELSLIHI